MTGFIKTHAARITLIAAGTLAAAGIAVVFLPDTGGIFPGGMMLSLAGITCALAGGFAKLDTRKLSQLLFGIAAPGLLIYIAVGLIGYAAGKPFVITAAPDLPAVMLVIFGAARLGLALSISACVTLAVEEISRALPSREEF